MSRLEEYLKGNLVCDFIVMYESTVQVSEMTDTTFSKIKSAGKKMGFKVEKSKSLFSYFKSLDKGFTNLLRYASLYMMTNVTDNASRKELVGDMKNVMKGINKKEVVAFILQLDKVSVGLSSMVRHIFQSVLGIEISGYYNWIDDLEWLQKTMKDIRVVLNRMDGMNKELKALKDFEKILLGDK